MLREALTEYGLSQEYAVGEISERFGEQFVYENDNGNLAISKNVLKQFRLISADIVVWYRDGRTWFARDRRDDPGRQQS